MFTKQRLAFAALHNMPVDALVALAAGLGGWSSKQPAYDSHHLPAEAAAVTEVLARRNFVAVPGLSVSHGGLASLLRLLHPLFFRGLGLE